mmetsp:Transcript_26075/g.37073  ORF Transcript_26075/g.37073 Transcript_26075/m.37073 type:complete len:97 (+) Transcript_26075:434-724(+)
MDIESVYILVSLTYVAVQVLKSVELTKDETLQCRWWMGGEFRYVQVFISFFFEEFKLYFIVVIDCEGDVEKVDCFCQDCNDVETEFRSYRKTMTSL